MITITQPKPEEAEEIHELVKQSWYTTYVNEKVGITKKDIDLIYEDEPEKQIKALKDRLENPKPEDLHLVAKDGEKIVGFIRLKIHADKIELRTMYVLPTYYGQGVGTKMWQEALKLLPVNKPIEVEVATYTKAKDFYKKLGFVDTSERSAKTKMLSSGTMMPAMKMVLKR